MTSVSLLDVCFISTCSNALFTRGSHPLNINKAVVAAKRTTTRARANSPIWKHRHPSHHRRHQSSPSSPSRRRRSGSFAYCPPFLRKAPLSFALTKVAPKRIEPIRLQNPPQHPQQEQWQQQRQQQSSPPRQQQRLPPAPSTPRRLPRDYETMEQMLPIHHGLEQAMFEDAPSPAPAPQARLGGGRPRVGTDAKNVAEDILSTPPTPSRDDLSETRSTRSASSASRNPNRLSLTLPIAPPTPNPSRPTPAAAAISFPPTPSETPSLMSPVDPGDFITAIAAQERRVLELKEELNRAELELTKLKRQFAREESRRKAQGRRNVEPLRPVAPLVDLDDAAPSRRSVEIDRRKALLLGQQQSQQNTPDKNRRRVFRGGHARTLSLLSPIKTSEGFSVLEDGVEDPKSAREEEPDSPFVRNYAPVTASQLAKRSSWAPRSAYPQTSAMKQIADDLKTGLWTFVEDLRQVAVGDEPITGQGRYLRGADGNMRETVSQDDSSADNQDTIRASGAAPRPRAKAAFEETPTPAARSKNPQSSEGAPGSGTAAKHTRGLSRSKTEGSMAATKSRRHYSWTPLTVDDDEDWSSWESPAAQSTDRWSGSTVVNGEIISTIPEKGDENETTLNKRASASHLSDVASAGTPGKLEELLPPMLNRLTPSNLKKHASDFLTEWEKSLSTPPSQTTAPVADTAV